MAPNFKVSPGLTKWWKSYIYTNGQRIQVQSPYRRDHITPFFKHLPESAVKKVTENIVDVGPSFAFLVFVMWWGDKTFEEEQKKHRS